MEDIEIIDELPPRPLENLIRRGRNTRRREERRRGRGPRQHEEVIDLTEEGGGRMEIEIARVVVERRDAEVIDLISDEETPRYPLRSRTPREDRQGSRRPEVRRGRRNVNHEVPQRVIIDAGTVEDEDVVPVLSCGGNIDDDVIEVDQAERSDVGNEGDHSDQVPVTRGDLYLVSGDDGGLAGPFIQNVGVEGSEAERMQVDDNYDEGILVDANNYEGAPVDPHNVERVPTDGTNVEGDPVKFSAETMPFFFGDGLDPPVPGPSRGFDAVPESVELKDVKPQACCAESMDHYNEQYWYNYQEGYAQVAAGAYTYTPMPPIHDDPNQHLLVNIKTEPYDADQYQETNIAADVFGHVSLKAEPEYSYEDDFPASNFSIQPDEPADPGPGTSPFSDRRVQEPMNLIPWLSTPAGKAHMNDFDERFLKAFEELELEEEAEAERERQEAEQRRLTRPTMRTRKRQANPGDEDWVDPAEGYENATQDLLDSQNDSIPLLENMFGVHSPVAGTSAQASSSQPSNNNEAPSGSTDNQESSNTQTVEALTETSNNVGHDDLDGAVTPQNKRAGTVNGQKRKSTSKKKTGKPPSPSNAFIPLSTGRVEGNVYQVENIVDSRMSAEVFSLNIEYRTKWWMWPHKHDSWLLAKSFHTPCTVLNFWKWKQSAGTSKNELSICKEGNCSGDVDNNVSLTPEVDFTYCMMKDFCCTDPVVPDSSLKK